MGRGYSLDLRERAVAAYASDDGPWLGRFGRIDASSDRALRRCSG